MFVHHTNVADAAKDSRRLVCYDCGIACDLDRMREERVGFLTKMGAAEPDPRRKLPIAPARADAPKDDASPPADAPDDAPPPPRAPRHDQPEAMRPLQSGGPAERFRIQFSKTGPLALLGHLDLIRELPRVIRRAGVKTAYTKGFHPKADMTFSPALSLGVASLSEYLDVRLIDAPDADELVARLNAASSGGLAFPAAARLGPADPRVSAVLDSASYAVALARHAVDELGGVERLAELIRAFEAAETAPVRRSIDGIGRIIDVKRFVSSVRLGGQDSVDLVRRAGIVGGYVPLEVSVRITQNGSAKIVEVVEAITGEAGFPFKAVRTALTGGGASAMDLAAHRKPLAAATQAAASPAE
jgi:radical SAM-linked protein